MEDCTPEINPSYELQIIWWIGLCIENIEYSFVKHSDRSQQSQYRDISRISYNFLNSKIPVTPTIVRGCAPKTEKMNAAMNEASNTSMTPYCSVVSIRSREKAIPGRTLRHIPTSESKYFGENIETHLEKKVRAVAGTTRQFHASVQSLRYHGALARMSAKIPAPKRLRLKNCMGLVRDLAGIVVEPPFNSESSTPC